MAPEPAVVAELHEESGRYLIDRAAVGTMLPPTSPEAEDFSIDSLAELDDATVSLIPEPPEAALTSGIFRRSPSAPPPGWGERAELEIVDLSLSYDNPLLASSLVPPPKRPFSWGRALGIGAGVLAAASVAGFAAFAGTRALHASEAVATPRAPASAAAPMAVEAMRPPVVEASAEAPSAAPEEAAPAVPPEPEPAVSEAATQAPVETAPLRAPAAVEKRTAAAPPAPPEPAPATERPAPTPVASTAPAVEPTTAAAAPAPIEPTLHAPVAAAAPAPVAEVEAAEPEAPSEPLPTTLTREQVAAGFEALHATFVECAAGGHGIVTIHATITSSGRVAGTLVEGAFQGTPAGSCMARAARATRFPAFSGESFKVSYPLSL